MYKASALKNGEDICSNYRKTTGSDVIALRIEELSFETKKPEEAVDTCTRMCSELLRENSITKESEKYSLFILQMWSKPCISLLIRIC